MTDPAKFVEREAFEAWISEQSWFRATIGLIRTHPGSNDYDDPCINSRWQGWQAHAQSVGIITTVAVKYRHRP